MGGPYGHLGWNQGCFLMHLEWFSSTEPNFWVKLPLWAACPFWHFQDIFGIRIQFKISYQQRELLNLWSSYKPKKLDTYFESLVHYRKWIHEYNYIMYFRLENQEASQSSIIRFICLSTKTTLNHLFFDKAAVWESIKIQILLIVNMFSLHLHTEIWWSEIWKITQQQHTLVNLILK